MEEVDFADGVVVVFEVGGVAGEVLGGDVSGTDGLWRMGGNYFEFPLKFFFLLEVVDLCGAPSFGVGC